MAFLGDIDISRALAAAAKRHPAAGTPLKARLEALAMVGEEALAAPACCYQNLPLREAAGGLLDLGQVALHAPGLSEVSGKLSGVTAVACTLGPALEARVSELWAERKLSLALALDDLGNELLMYASRFASLKIRGEARERGLSSGETLTPGGKGLPLDQNRTVLAMAGGEGIGISVAGEGMLSPVKSRTMVVGIGTGLSARSHKKRCEICSSRERCRYRGR